MSAAQAVLSAWLLAVVAVATWTDLDRRLIPNRLTGTGALAAVALGLALDPAGQPGRLVAGAGAGGFLLVAALARPDDMGLGDVKLAGVMGLCLGAAAVWAMALALGLAALYGLGLIARRGVAAGRRATLPLGPFLAAGSVAAVALA